MASIFTKIINREIPAEIIYEDEQVIAFLDIRPVNPGHLLVVPKQEVDQFQDLDEAIYLAVMKVVRKMARLVKDKLSPARVGVVIYGFDVPHVHVHVIPMDQPGRVRMEHAAEVASEELAMMRERLTQ